MRQMLDACDGMGVAGWALKTSVTRDEFIRATPSPRPVQTAGLSPVRLPRRVRLPRPSSGVVPVFHTPYNYY